MKSGLSSRSDRPRPARLDAQQAKVSQSTVRDFESGRRTPIANNLAAMRTGMERAGVRFTFDGERAVGIAIAAALGANDHRGRGNPNFPRP